MTQLKNVSPPLRPSVLIPEAGSPPRPAPPIGTNLFCPVCGHEFLPDELGKKPHCRRCGYVES